MAASAAVRRPPGSKSTPKTLRGQKPREGRGCRWPTETVCGRAWEMPCTGRSTKRGDGAILYSPVALTLRAPRCMPDIVASVGRSPAGLRPRGGLLRAVANRIRGLDQLLGKQCNDYIR